MSTFNAFFISHEDVSVNTNGVLLIADTQSHYILFLYH